MKSHGKHSSPHQYGKSASRAGSRSMQSEPRQLAPGVMGRRVRSRHTAMRSGAIRGEYWLRSFQEKRFWIICAVVSVLTLSLLWSIKDRPALARTDWVALRARLNWKQTFFTREKAAVIKDGKVVEPAETYYTVPAQLAEPPESAKRFK